MGLCRRFLPERRFGWPRTQKGLRPASFPIVERRSSHRAPARTFRQLFVSSNPTPNPASLHFRLRGDHIVHRRTSFSLTAAKFKKNFASDALRNSVSVKMRVRRLIVAHSLPYFAAEARDEKNLRINIDGNDVGSVIYNGFCSGEKPEPQLRFAKLRFAELRFTELRFTELRFTELRFAKLRFT